MLHVFCLCRSTVEFAREVSEAKAMDDTVNKLEQMVSGGGESPASGPRRGLFLHQSTGEIPRNKR